MAFKIHVKTGDMVYILSGKDRGKKGKVIKVLPREGKVLVEGINMSTKHMKPTKRYQQGGIIKQESPISSSNVMLICDKCKNPTKVAKKVFEDGQKARVCKKCNEIIDVVKEAKEE